MRKFLKLDLNHILVPVAVVAVLLLVYFRGMASLQYEVVVVSAFIYIIVGLIHHHFDKSLTFEVLVEYILIAVLVLIILQGILL